MKKYTKIDKLEYKEYKPEYFPEIFAIFYEFQKENKISMYETLCKNQSELMIAMYLTDELKQLTSKCNKKFVGYIPETGEIVAFALFSENYFSKNCLELQFACKKNKYIYCKAFKECLFKCINNIRNDRKVVAVLGNRDKFKQYLNFIKRIIKIDVINEDQYQNTLIEIKM